MVETTTSCFHSSVNLQENYFVFSRFANLFYSNQIMRTITKMRKSIVPLKLGDKIAAGFVVSMIPVYYYFESYVVLPDIYPRGSSSYWINLLCSHIIDLNIIGNYVCMLLCDTSARAHYENVKKSKYSIEKSPSCDLCGDDCDLPPRTWHCSSCNTCILKRDHHCMFIGYCIGQYNRRFFVIFLLHMVIGSAYYFYHTTQFMRKRIDMFIPVLLVQVLFPPIILFSHPESTLHTVYLVLYILLILAMIMVSGLCMLNMFLMAKGIVGIEAKIGRKNHPQSTVVDNIKEVLGTRWYLTWIFPLITSDLSCERVLEYNH